MRRRGTSHLLQLFLLLSLALVASIATACGDEGGSTTSVTLSVSTDSTSVDTTMPGAPTDTVDTVPPVPSAFRSPFEAHTYLDPQPVDLERIANLASAWLSEEQKRVLARQSFVAVSPRAPAWKFWHLYETARYEGLPLLITTDSLLNAYHGLFDTLLQRMEEEALYEQTVIMSESLFTAAAEQWNSASDSTIKQEAALNMAYFAVARALLQGSADLPGIMGVAQNSRLNMVADLASKEVALIQAADSPTNSPILGYVEDYSQYKPRGHYTRSEKLERYLRAMMWYGHTAFYINPRDPDVPISLAESLTRRAVLVASSLTGPAKTAWSAVYEPTVFLVGRSDDLSVDDVRGVVTKVYGSAEPRPDDLADAAKLATLREELNKLPAPRILTAAARLPGDTENREENERSFRVMGQRYIPDSYAFQQLVWAYVGEESDKRDFPMGLDVMAVLGSDQAYTIAKDDFAQNQYRDWESQLDKVNKEFGSGDADLWPSNLYTGWLESFQHIFAPPGDGAPDFMKTRAWARKSLNTALGSWAELRHDTILYAKQSVTAEGAGGEEPSDPGYVEPYPQFYAKIGDLAATLRQGLLEHGLIDPTAANKLEMMITLSDTLRSIAEKQLAGQELALDEKITIQEYGHYLEILEQFRDDTEGRTLSPSPEKSPIVADVHTSYLSQKALEQATGYPLVLYAAIEINGRLQLYAGASYSYYEFTVPLEQRLTDEEWVAILDGGKAPPRPAWTNEWIVER